MDIAFMNSKNSKTSDLHRLLLKLSDKIDLKWSEKYISLSNLSINYTRKNTKKTSKNKFKVSAFTWNDKCEWPEGSYSVSDIQDLFEYLKKKYGEKTDNLTIRIHVNKIKNKITFKIKAGYYLEVLAPETKKLLGRSKCKKIKDENAENVPNLEVALLK